MVIINQSPGVDQKDLVTREVEGLLHYYAMLYAMTSAFDPGWLGLYNALSCQDTMYSFALS